MKVDSLNIIDIAAIKNCLPQRALLTILKSPFSIRVFCNPRMKERETEYCFESIRQVLPIQEFYSEEQGRDFVIYWHYNKSIPVEFINL